MTLASFLDDPSYFPKESPHLEQTRRANRDQMSRSSASASIPLSSLSIFLANGFRELDRACSGPQDWEWHLHSHIVESLAASR